MQKPAGDPWQSPSGNAYAGNYGGNEQRAEPRRLQLFEEKVALASARMYNEKDAPGWRIMTRNYWVGRTPHMRTFLEWIEAHPNEEITEDEIKKVKSGCELMIDIDKLEARQQMWAYLNMNLQGDIAEIFRNFEMLNGAEAWRRIVSLILSQSGAKRSRLRHKA